MDMLGLESRINGETYNFSGQISVYANDFKGNIIDINAEDKFESASTIKTYILAELYKQIHEGKINRDDILRYDEENYIVGSGVLRALDFGVELTVKNFATLMMIVSDNVATNVIIDLLGIDNINNTCKELGLNDTVLYNKIDFEKYSKLGTTTPKDYGKIFELIYKGELWSKEISDEIIEMLKKQHYNTILTRDLPQYFLDSENTGDEEVLEIASKSGSMNACRNDGGIVFTTYGGYVICIFAKDFQDSLYYSDHEAYRFGAKVARLIFDQYVALEGSFKLEK